MSLADLQNKVQPKPEAHVAVVSHHLTGSPECNTGSSDQSKEQDIGAGSVISEMDTVHARNADVAGSEETQHSATAENKQQVWGS